MAVWVPGPVPFTRDRLHQGMRIVDFRFDLLDKDETEIGRLTTVKPGGSIEWDVGTAIKAAGSIEVVQIDEEIEWLDLRIRVSAFLDALGDNETRTLEPIGIFLPAAPVERWSGDTGLVWTVELTDKLAILDQDIVTDSAGNPVSFVAKAGRNIIELVKTLIHETGETSQAIAPAGAQVRQDMVWDLGTSRLQIINDLLAAASHSSLRTDALGQFIAPPYVPPADRPALYEVPVNPFSWGGNSLVSPDFTRDRDIYAIPNRYVAISNGSGGTGTEDGGAAESEALVSVAVNDDPSSRFSYQARGRWITHTETGVEAATQADLDLRARQGLAQKSAVTSRFEVHHYWLPDLDLSGAVRFVHRPSQTRMLCYPTKISLPLDPNELCQTTLQEALA